LYKGKVAAFSGILTKDITQFEHHLEFMNIKPDGK